MQLAVTLHRMTQKMHVESMTACIIVYICLLFGWHPVRDTVPYFNQNFTFGRKATITRDRLASLRSSLACTIVVCRLATYRKSYSIHKYNSGALVSFLFQILITIDICTLDWL